MVSRAPDRNTMVPAGCQEVCASLTSHQTKMQAAPRSDCHSLFTNQAGPAKPTRQVHTELTEASARRRYPRPRRHPCSARRTVRLSLAATLYAARRVGGQHLPGEAQTSATAVPSPPGMRAFTARREPYLLTLERDGRIRRQALVRRFDAVATPSSPMRSRRQRNPERGKRSLGAGAPAVASRKAFTPEPSSDPPD
jgi:hypothetical protein